MAVIYTPSYFTVVTFTTEPAFNDGRHSNIIAASPHIEYVRMAYIASKAKSMKPVGEYDWPHTFLISIPVENYVCILALRHRCKHHHPKYHRYDYRVFYEHLKTPLEISPHRISVLTP
jgi:hypothetical protein